MKQMIKYTLAIATLFLVTLGASAQPSKIIYKLDGVVQNESSAPGTVVVDFNTCTITVTPGSGNYLTADELSAVKVVDGSLATTRNGEPGFNTPVTITAKNANADPSTTTEYTFEALGDENYGLEVTADFQSRISISDATVSGLADSYTYTGEAIKPVVTVKVGDNTLTLNTDYRAVYTDSINASTDDVKGKITLSGLRKYTGTQVVEYIIAKADPTLTFAPATATITFGNEAAFEKPVLTTTPVGLAVTYQVNDGDDNVAQVNGSNGDITPLFPGEATIEAVFAGNNNYNEAKGQYTLTVAKGTAKVTVAPVAKDNLTYTGGDLELVNEGTATNGEMMYRIGTEGDFSAEIPTGNAAGQYTVYYKATAIYPDQFNDSEALSITVTIKPKSIENATITLKPESFTYNGQEQMPEVSVKDGETDLVFDQDYTLTNEGGTNVGEYTVTVTGKGNYDSQTTKKANFNITALETTPTVTLTETSIVYDGTEKKPAVKVTVVLPGAEASTELTTDDYDVAYSDNVNAGKNTAKATVTLKGNYVGQNTATFTITPKSIANAAITLTPESFTYNEQNQKPEVSVKDGETDLVLGQDYTLTNDGGTNVGEYTVTVTGKGNYDSETSASKKYYITAGSMEVTAGSYEGTYDGNEYGITVIAPEGATIKYGTTEGTYDLDDSPTYSDAGEYTIYYRATKVNFADVTGSAKVTLNQAAITKVILENAQLTFNPDGQTVTITKLETETVDVTGEDIEKYFNIEGATQTEAGNYTVTVTAKTDIANNNFKGSATADWVITLRTKAKEDIEFSGNSYRTFYDANESWLLPDGLSAYLVTGVGGTTVTITQVSFIKAGVPVLVKNAAGAALDTETPDATFATNMLKYVSDENGFETTGNEYVLYMDEFVKATGNIPVDKCYLDLSTTPSGTRSFTIDDSGTTGINRIDNEQLTIDNDVWFDLQGKRIEKPTKDGLYIKNGRKVIVNTK